MTSRRVMGLVLATCLAALAGCSGIGSSGNGKVTLRYWVYQFSGPGSFDTAW